MIVAVRHAAFEQLGVGLGAAIAVDHSLLAAAVEVTAWLRGWPSHAGILNAFGAGNR